MNTDFSSNGVEVPIPAANEQKLSLYKQGLKHMHAGIPDTDITKAISLFNQAWAEGDPNAGYMLCHAYGEGLGVPRNYEQVRAIAEKLIDMGYYPAYMFLSELYANGYCVEQDKAKSEHYSAELERSCRAPMEGVDEILRYDALISNLVSQDQPDFRRLENLARENLLISDLPQRYTWCAMSLLRIISILGDESPTIMQELKDAISKGIQAGDRSAYCLKALLLEQTNLYGEGNEKEALKLSRYISKIELEDASTWFHILLRSESQQEIEESRQRFWEICNYGSSRMKRENELNCLISLQPSASAGTWRILPKNKLEELMEQEQYSELFTPDDPLILLENESHNLLADLKLRICSPDVGLDKTIDLPNVMEMGESLSIPLAADHGIAMGSKAYITVHSHDKYSEMSPLNFNGIDDFRRQMPPLLMWWELGAFGGCILKIKNMGQAPITGIRVTKLQSEVTSKEMSLQPEQITSVGWVEFDDSKSLTIGEGIIITAQEQSTVVGYIHRD